MPPRTRRTATADLSKSLVLGVIGQGELDPKEIQATLNDLFETPEIDRVEVIFANTDEAMGDGAWAAFEYVADNINASLSIAAVVKSDGNEDDAALAGSAEDAKARMVPVVGDDIAAVVVADELIKAKAAGADARLLVFLVTDEDPDVDSGGQYAAIESAVQGGVPAFNITDGMDDINIGDPEAEQAAPEPPPAEAPRRGRGRPSNASKAAEAAATTTPAAEETPPTRTRGRGRAKAAEEIEGQETVAAAVNGSDAAVGSILDLFAEMVATKVAEKLK